VRAKYDELIYDGVIDKILSGAWDGYYDVEFLDESVSKIHKRDVTVTGSITVME